MDTARVADSIILASRGPQINQSIFLRLLVNHTIFKIQNKILPKLETDISPIIIAQKLTRNLYHLIILQKQFSP